VQEVLIKDVLDQWKDNTQQDTELIIVSESSIVELSPDNDRREAEIPTSDED
jgi:hypothetical protein